MSLRVQRIKNSLKKQNIDALVVLGPSNISYATEYPSRDSYLIISKTKNIYLTDPRYTDEARLSLGKSFNVQEIKDNVFNSIADTANKLKVKKLGFEAKHLSFVSYQKLKERMSSKVELVPIAGLVETFRQEKEPKEIANIRQAVEITQKALEFAKTLMLPGIREIDIVGELERFIRYNGASNTGFDIIVASGSNSAFPHHISSSKKLKDNEPVLIDIGVEYNGYKSDLTRVFFLGKINTFVARIYDLVLKAKKAAISQIKPGVSIAKIDTSARQVIAKAGFGRHFGHSLGHGIGLEVHEEPKISEKNKGRLTEGMIFTVEPAVYLVGKFGIRIEDVVLVTKKGCEVLSGTVNQ